MNHIVIKSFVVLLAFLVIECFTLYFVLRPCPPNTTDKEESVARKVLNTFALIIRFFVVASLLLTILLSVLSLCYMIGIHWIPTPMVRWINTWRRRLIDAKVQLAEANHLAKIHNALL